MEVYAELSKKQYRRILNDEVEICVPYDVTMKNRAGSRALYFECDGKDAFESLVGGLDASGIAWQENGEREWDDEDN